MKCYSHMKTSIVIFLALLTLIACKRSYSRLTTKQEISVFDESEAKFFTKFSKNINCATKPLSESCFQCLDDTTGYKFYYFFQTKRLHKYHYKMMINYNDELKRVVISFAGPSVDHFDYIKLIYEKGFSIVNLYKVNIEKEFAYVYFRKLRHQLVQRIELINASGRDDFDYVFTGYSTGGSIATLAAFDLTRSEVIWSPQVYTYGSLRIGDAAFVAMVNATVKVWRIVKSTDFIVRIPTCYYSTNQSVWRCFSQPIINKFILQKTFPLRIYVKNYVTMYRKSNPILKEVVSHPQKLLQKNQKKDNHKKENQNSNNNSKNILPNVLVLKGEKKLKNDIKNEIDALITSNKSPKEVKKEIYEKLTSAHKFLFKLRKNNFNNFKNKKTDKKESKKLNKFKAEDTARNKDKPAEANSPIKNIAQVQSTQPTQVIYKTYVPTITTIKKVETYKIEQIFYKFIYYTQPIGLEIFYDDKMTSYKSCDYKMGVSVCEESLSLPTSFKVESHKLYYDELFDQCNSSDQ